jgi:hypothetical protein
MMLGTGLRLERQNTVALSFPLFNHDNSRERPQTTPRIISKLWGTTIDVAQDDRAS